MEVGWQCGSGWGVGGCVLLCDKCPHCVCFGMRHPGPNDTSPLNCSFCSQQLCPIVQATWPVKQRGEGVWERKIPSLLTGRERLPAFWGALNSWELARPISRRNQMQIKQSLGALAVQRSLSAPSHCAHSNGLPCKLLSSVCVFSFLRDDSSQVKGHFSSDKTFLLLSEFCVCFLAKPTAAWALCAAKHFPFLYSEASQGLWGVLTSIAWSEYHSSIAI